MKARVMNTLLPAVVLLSFAGAHPAFAFVNGQNAKYVLGQSNFTTNASNLGAAGMFLPSGMTYDPAGRLFVSDTHNNRVLVFDFNVTPLGNGIFATYVLGQPNFTTNSFGASSTAMNSPGGLAYDASTQRLFVTDNTNNRVLVFDFTVTPLVAPTDPTFPPAGIPATYVLGQQNFTSHGVSATSASTMNLPWGLAFDPADRLFVADVGNNRVMVFDFTATPLVAPTDPTFPAAGIPATYVLGQTNTVSNSPNVSMTGISAPKGVTYDPSAQRLFVTNNQTGVKVFDFTVTPINTGIPAMYVLGNGCSFFPAQTQNQLCEVVGMSIDSSRRRLFATNLNRVSEFDLWGGIVNAMNAAHVLGQPDFGSSSSAATASGLATSYDASYDASNQRLFVLDSANNRVMVFYDNDLAGTPNVSCAGLSNYTICGNVTAAENTSVTLSGVPIKLRNAQGDLVAVVKTDGSGNYIFGSLTPNATYYVAPVVGRTQSANPLQFPIQNLQSVGAQVNLQIQGWPGTLQVNTGSVASFVLISTGAYNGTNAPALSPNAANGNFETAVAGADGTANVSLPAGTYYLTCWKAQLSGATMAYTRDPVSGSGGPFASLSPNQVEQVACP